MITMKLLFKKILLVLIICLIIIVSFFITDNNFNITGKPTFVFDSNQSIPIDSIDVSQPACKLEIEPPQYISTEKTSVNLRIRYSTTMDTTVEPKILLYAGKDEYMADLSQYFLDTDYYLEDSNWTTNQDFRTKLFFTKDDVVAEKVYFVISGAISDKGKIPQQTFYSNNHDTYITIDTQKPKLEFINIISDKDRNISQITFVFNKELAAINNNLHLINKDQDERIEVKIDPKKPNQLITETKFIDKDGITDYALKITSGTIQDSYKNQNDDIYLLFKEYENYDVIILPEEIIPEENYLKIESFDLLIASNRAAITFEEKVYSNTNNYLTKSNFQLYKNNNLLENGIKEVSHINNGLFVVLLFNEIISNPDEYSIDIINVFDENGTELKLENKVVGADNSINQQKYLPLIKGWNLISVGSVENWDLVPNLSDNQNIETFFYFNDKWQSIPIIKYTNDNKFNYSAFFIKSPIPQKLFLPINTEPEEFNIDNLFEGWNLIGFSKYANNTFILEDIITQTNEATIILKGTSNYNLVDISYDLSNTTSNEASPLLSPFEGYWIYKENRVIE